MTEYLSRSVSKQKPFNFSALRSGQAATKAGAFQRGRGRGESQRFPRIPAFGEAKREGAMEDVACAERIHGVDRKGRCFLQFAPLIQPDRAARAAGRGKERRRQPRERL